jgi:hypothetical protein
MQSAGRDPYGGSDGDTLAAADWNCLRFWGRPQRSRPPFFFGREAL